MKLTIVLSKLTISVLIVSNLFAIAPPKKGVAVPKNFDKKQELLAESYSNSGLAKSIQLKKLEIQRLSKATGLNKVSLGSTPSKIAIPVLLGEYSNSTAKFTTAEIDTMLFGNNPTGSMIDYYDEISYGQFTLSGTVSSWSKLTNDQAFYVGADNGGDGEAARFCYDVAADQDASIDFSLYDNDGPDGVPNSGDDDGYVDVLVVVHTGGGAETGDDDNIWSHRWSFFSANHFYATTMPFDSYTTNDAAHGGGFIKINDYMIQPEMDGTGAASDPLIDIGVFCHEFGHALGLPDLYDTDPENGESAGIGLWGLMAAGSYGGDYQHANTPTHMCAWSKEFLGWITPTVVQEEALSQVINAVETNSEAFKIEISPSEYFLIENRAKTGFDQYLRGAGLCIWHIDDNNADSSNADEDNKLVDLEEADGLAHLDSAFNSADAGDLFPGQTINRLFASNTNPNSNDNSGANSHISIANISDAGAVMTADFLFADPPPDSTIVLYSEGFEGGIPTDWIVYDQDGDGRFWSIRSETATGADVAYTGDKGTGCSFDSSGNDDWLVTPPGDLPANSEIAFSFYGRSRQSGFPEDFNVLLSTTGAAISDFTVVLDTVRGASVNWTEYSYDISAYAGQSVHLAVQLVSVDQDNLYLDDFEVLMKGSPNPVSIAEDASLPAEFTLMHNYPNPFNPVTNIRYSLAEASDVSLIVYDISGREVMTLVEQSQAAGWYTTQWNGMAANGTQVETGVYFARISAGTQSQVIKMVYLR